jgi:uncharacterized protein YjiS (DUF1127 family)
MPTAHRRDQTEQPITLRARRRAGNAHATDGVADQSRRNTIMSVFRLPASVRTHLYGATEPRGAPTLRWRQRHGHRQQLPAAVRQWLAVGTKTLPFREKEHEMPSLQQGPGSRSTFRLVLCVAGALLASGVSIISWFLRQRDYRRTLNELNNLNEQDLRELRISKADFSAIARAEAERLHNLRRRSQQSTVSRTRN